MKVQHIIKYINYAEIKKGSTSKFKSQIIVKDFYIINTTKNISFKSSSTNKKKFNNLKNMQRM